MIQRVFVALLTVAVFLAGYAVRGWADRKHPVPPPPAVVAQEYGLRNAKGQDAKRRYDPAKLVVEIQKNLPQIEAFRAQVEDIEAGYERELLDVFNAEQREKYLANKKRAAERGAKKVASSEPLTDEDIYRERESPLANAYFKVAITYRLEELTRVYKLDAPQQTSVRALLTLRRDKYLALYDTAPHPTVRLSRLAPLIERVAAATPAAKSDAAPAK